MGAALKLVHRVVPLARALLVGAALACGACDGCRPAPPTPEAGAAPSAVVEPPVPPPEGLLAETWVQTPDATWAQLQHEVSGVAALLPPAAGEALGTLAGLDARVARQLDGKSPWYVVVASGAAGGDVAWAAGLPLTGDLATELRQSKADGGATDGGHDVGGMYVLGSDPATASFVFAVASPRWLILAPTERELARLGPYAYRTMPTKAAPGPAPVEASVPRAALAGPVSSQLSARWEATRAWLAARDDEQRAKHGGRAPDFGDPRAILDALDGAVKRRIALVGQASAARIELSVPDGDLRADVLLTPGPGEAGVGLVAGMHPGDARPLGELPAESIAAVLAREDAPTRASDARDLEAALDGALGSRAHAEDTAAVHAAIDDWERARGDWMTTALAWGGTDGSRGLLLRTPSVGGDGAVHATRALLDLSHRPAFEALLSGSMHVAPATVAPVDVPSVTRASLAKLASRGGDAHPPPPLAVAWGLHDAELVLAAGTAPTGLLAVEATPAKRLGDDPRMARVLAGLGPDVALALVAQPLRFDPVRAGTDDALEPFALAWGRKGGDAWLRVELAGALLRELIRLKAGL